MVARRAASAEPRDYYRVEDMRGRRFWVYRDGLYTSARRPARWYLHRAVRDDGSPAPYAELQVTTQFLASCAAPRIPRSWSQRAAALGLAAIAVTDRNTLAGVVRAHVAAKDARASGWSSARGSTSPTRPACCACRPTAPPMAG